MNGIDTGPKTIQIPLIITFSLSVILGIAVVSVVPNGSLDTIIIPVQGQNQDEQSLNRQSPDDDCLFNPSLDKCSPTVGGSCPEGFSMNADAQCYPRKSCPSDFERRDGDETGACYPTESSPSA